MIEIKKILDKLTRYPVRGGESSNHGDWVSYNDIGNALIAYNVERPMTNIIKIVEHGKVYEGEKPFTCPECRSTSVVVDGRGAYTTCSCQGCSCRWTVENSYLNSRARFDEIQQGQFKIMGEAPSEHAIYATESRNPDELSITIKKMHGGYTFKRKDCIQLVRDLVKLLSNHFVDGSVIIEVIEPNCLKCSLDGRCSVALKSLHCYNMFRFNKHD